MITKKIRTTGGKVSVTIPGTLAEVTLGQMMELQEKPTINDLEAISILSGLPVQELQNVINMADLGVFGDAILHISQQIKYLYDSDDIPKSIQFFTGGESRTVKVIHNLSIEPAGAFMASRDIIAEEIAEHIRLHGEDDWQANFNPSLKACCQVLAHYFYCRATGKPYNEYAAEQFADEIKKLRVTEALPIAKHFFTCYPGLSKPKISCFRRLQQRWKKKPGYKPLKSLSTSIP